MGPTQSTPTLQMPRYAWLSFTGRCNLFCAHCSSRVWGRNALDAEDMPLGLFERIEKEVFPHLQVCRIGGNNNGEQLLSRDWDRFMERMMRYPFTLHLITNGTRLERRRIKTLVERECILDISIEGATEKTYRRVRGVGFDSLIEKIKTIHEERTSQKKRCEMRFAFTAFHDNITELPALVKLARDLKVDRIDVFHFVPNHKEQRYQSLLFHRSLSNRCFAEAKSLADAFGITMKLPPMFPTGDITRVDGTGDGAYPWMRSKCQHPRTTISINERGDVTPCCLSNTVMGNLGKQSLAEIWESRIYGNLRRRVNSRDPWIECRHCLLRGGKFTSVHSIDEEALLWAVGPWWHVEKTLLLHVGRKHLKGLLRKSKRLDRWVKRGKAAAGKG